MRTVPAIWHHIVLLTLALSGCRRPCNVPDVTNDPSVMNWSFPIACADCDAAGAPYCESWRGSVCYPVGYDGSTAFSSIATRFGPVPVVFMVHGGANGSPQQYNGFRYFQETLAKIGLVAVSVDPMPFAQHRDAVIAAIKHFRRASLGEGIFADKLDFRRLGLMGHSRGGGAVVSVPEQIRQLAAILSTEPAAQPLLKQVTVKAVIAVNAQSP